MGLPNRLWSPLLFALFLVSPLSSWGQETLILRESWSIGQTYQISIRADLKGKIILPDDPQKKAKSQQIDLYGNSKIDYDERILKLDSQRVVQVLRHYQGMDFQRTVGQQTQESQLRPQARLVMIHRETGRSGLIFSPLHPLTWHEVDQIRMDQFFPLLQGLLPQGKVRVGDRWLAETATLLELADLESIKDAKIECQLAEVRTTSGQRYAVIHFHGQLFGQNRDGDNRQKLNGELYFDLVKNQIIYLSMNGVSALLDQKGAETGWIEGRFVITRKPSQSNELTDEALSKLQLEPNARNTALLFADADLGMSFVYPRTWKIREADQRQVIVDFPEQGGFVITREPLAQTPTIHQFQSEVQNALKQQKVTILKSEQPVRVRSAPDILDRFRCQVETNDRQQMQLEYFVLRQSVAGATVAARYPQPQAPSLAAEMEQMLNSLKLFAVAK